MEESCDITKPHFFYLYIGLVLIMYLGHCQPGFKSLVSVPIQCLSLPEKMAASGKRLSDLP